MSELALRTKGRHVYLPARAPVIVCLCGSTRFKEAFIAANFRETMAGRIVLSVGWFSHADGQIHTPTEAEKAALDALHLRKVELADEVLVLDCPRPRCARCLAWCLVDRVSHGIESVCCRAGVRWAAYVGESTSREIAHARALGRKVRYLSQESPPPQGGF